jgi:hypothetical protein
MGVISPHLDVLGGRGIQGRYRYPPYTPLLGDWRDFPLVVNTMIWYKDKTPYIRDIGVM